MSIPIDNSKELEDSVVIALRRANGNHDVNGDLVAIEESQGCQLIDHGLATVLYWGDGPYPGAIRINAISGVAIARVLNQL